MNRKRRLFRKPLFYVAVCTAILIIAVIINHFRPVSNGKSVGDTTEQVELTVFQSDSDHKCIDSTPDQGIPPEDDSPSPGNPWVAIIIDDFGPPIEDELIQGFMDLPFDITISIIPGNLKTESTGLSALRHSREVFIHLPMQPTKPIALKERDMVFIDSDRDVLAEILDRAAKELPMSSGLNNHMGSLATTDHRLMNMLADELYIRKLVFVDSRTVSKSCALHEMHKKHVPALGRDIFLDYYTGDDQIRSQLSKLVGLARNRGWSVGIGHARQSTLNVLRKELPVYSDNNIHFVTVGTLIEAIKKKAEVTQQ